MVFQKSFRPEIGTLFGEYGCIGHTAEFARWISKENNVIRVYPWDGPFFPIYREEFDSDSELCPMGLRRGFEVVDRPFQILLSNENGAPTERDVFLDIPRCESRNILFSALNSEMINGGSPIDSLSIHASQAPIDSYFRFDTQDLTISGNMTDSVVIHNTQNLSDEDFLSAFSNGVLRLDNIPVSDSITLELRVYDFLNLDGKTINIRLTGDPPCDEWSTSTDEYNSDGILFPNPFSDRLIMPESWLGCQYSMYDLNGVSLDFGIIGKAYCDMNHLSVGTYILQVLKGDSTLETYKLVKI